MTGIIRALLKHGLIEAPIGDIQATDLRTGDNASTFPKEKDWALVSRPALQKRIINTFKNSPFNIDLYLYNLNDPQDGSLDKYIDLRGILSTKEELQTLRELFGNTQLPQPKPGRITVIMFHHREGQDPLTPWMVAHRIAHGIEGDWLNWEEFDDLLNDVGIDSENWETQVVPVFRMKSARDGIIPPGSMEMINEIMTEFILTGNIRVAPLIFPERITDDPIPVDDLSSIDLENTEFEFEPEEAKKLQNQLIKLANSYVNFAVGKLWVAD